MFVSVETADMGRVGRTTGFWLWCFQHITRAGEHGTSGQNTMTTPLHKNAGKEGRGIFTITKRAVPTVEVAYEFLDEWEEAVKRAGSLFNKRFSVVGSYEGVGFLLSICRTLGIAVTLPEPSMSYDSGTRVLDDFLVSPVFGLEDWPDAYVFHVYHERVVQRVSLDPRTGKPVPTG